MSTNPSGMLWLSDLSWLIPLRPSPSPLVQSNWRTCGWLARRPCWHFSFISSSSSLAMDNLFWLTSPGGVLSWSCDRNMTFDALDRWRPDRSFIGFGRDNSGSWALARSSNGPFCLGDFVPRTDCNLFSWEDIKITLDNHEENLTHCLHEQLTLLCFSLCTMGTQTNYLIQNLAIVNIQTEQTLW